MLLRILPHDLAAEVFEHLSVDDQEKMLHALGTEQVAQILNDLPPDDRTALLEELPAAATQKLLNLLAPQERKIATDLLGYPKGFHRPAHDARIRRHQTELDRRRGARPSAPRIAQRDSMNQLYVVDDKGRLVDFVRLRNLVVAEPQTPVVELLENQNLALARDR